jgi:hypothetical protein
VRQTLITLVNELGKKNAELVFSDIISEALANTLTVHDFSSHIQVLVLQKFELSQRLNTNAPPAPGSKQDCHTPSTLAPLSWQPVLITHLSALSSQLTLTQIKISTFQNNACYTTMV